MFQEHNIEVGDLIEVVKNGRKYTGILMPRYGLGDPNTLVLKLKNGYNIGLKLEGGFKIRLIKKGRRPVFPEKKITRKEGLPSISLIATGGTIGSRVDYLTGGVYMCVKPEELLYIIPELEDLVNIERISSPFLLASEDLTYKEWIKIAELTAKELNSGVDGVVITHGTDTLHYTSAALSFMLRNLCKPVAIVGAQRSPDRGSSDGAMNLICASIFASRAGMAEVAAVSHASLNDDYCYAIRGTKVRKMHTSRRDTFRPINDLPLAKIWPNGKIEIVNQRFKPRCKGEVELDAVFEPKVALIKAYPGSDPEVIDFFVDKEYKGIVIEGTGFGHVPTQTLDPQKSWLPKIKRAIEEGVTIVMTSQTIYGRVNPYVYRNLRLVSSLGVIYAEDMHPETAYVKLGWVLAHTKDPKQVKAMMLTNYAGEITPRSLFNEFLI